MLTTIRLDDPAARDLWARLQAHAFDPPGRRRTLARRLADEQGWSDAHTARVIEEYRRFVLLTQVAGGEMTPSVEVDQVWHAHMLYSRDYWDGFCRDTLRRPLHHGPNAGGEEQDRRYHAQYEETLRAYARVFGEAPPHDIWPAAEIRFRHRGRWVDAGRDLVLRAADLEPLDRPSRLALGALAGTVSPYVMARLSGGPSLVSKVALASLHGRGWIEFGRQRASLRPGAPSAAPADLPAEEARVLAELRLQEGAGRAATLPLTLEHPELTARLQDEGWLTPRSQPLPRARGFGHPVVLFKLVLIGLVAALLLQIAVPFGLLALGVLVYQVVRHWEVPEVVAGQPTEEAQRAVTVMRSLLPAPSQVRADSPLLGLVIAAGLVGATLDPALQSTREALAPKPSSDSGGGGGCSGGGSDGGGGGGDGGGGGCGGGGCGGGG